MAVTHLKNDMLHFTSVILRMDHLGCTFGRMLSQ
jgi:hypothetical protein